MHRAVLAAVTAAVAQAYLRGRPEDLGTGRVRASCRPAEIDLVTAPAGRVALVVLATLVALEGPVALAGQAEPVDPVVLVVPAGSADPEVLVAQVALVVRAASADPAVLVAQVALADQVTAPIGPAAAASTIAETPSSTIRSMQAARTGGTAGTHGTRRTVIGAAGSGAA